MADVSFVVQDALAQQCGGLLPANSPQILQTGFAELRKQLKWKVHMQNSGSYTLGLAFRMAYHAVQSTIVAGSIRLSEAVKD